MMELSIVHTVAISAFIIGAIFGAVAQRSDFCTMGSLSDIVFMGDWNRFRSWMLATATAIIGSQSLHYLGVVELSESIYLSTRIGWLGAILGGLMFGFGMVIAGGCGNKTLVRLGAGNLKSVFVAIFMGIFGYMTARGLFAQTRVDMQDMSDITLDEISNQGLPEFFSYISGSSSEVSQIIMTVIVAGGLLIFCFKNSEFRQSTIHWASGIILGLLVVAAWYATGVIGFDDFDPTPLNAISFVSPTGESIQYLMTYSGATINFGIALVGGVIVGSFIAAILTKTFHIEAFNNADDMIRHMIGGAMMGVGGIMALGCTIGQGISGMSTLSFVSIIALLSIIAGAVYGLKYLETGSFIEPLKFN